MSTLKEELIQSAIILKNIQDLGPLATQKELEFSKQRRKYEEISRLILNCEVKEVPQYNKDLNEKETKKLVYELLFEIFSEENIEDFLNKIVVSPNLVSSEFDCATEIDIYSKIVNIHIYGFQNLVTVPNLCHEFIHANYENMPIEEIVKRLSNYHYREIPSITTEMICAEKAEDKTNLPFIDAMNTLRINHLQTLHNELENMIKHEHQIKDNQLLKDILTCTKHYTFQYTISDIYATNLFYFYMQDKEKFLKLFKSMLNNQITMLDLLSYYNISLNNYETVAQYKKKIESVSK